MSATVVLITGASTGIGKAIATHLAQQGYRVFGTSRKPDPQPTDAFTMLALDVTRLESIQACVAQVIAQAGRIDILINNAGMVGVLAAAEETTPEDWQTVFQTNLFGVVAMTNAVLPQMRQQGSGRIINISSGAGFIAMPPYTSIYTASKHALEGYTEALRYELQPFNIQACTVQLGYIRSNIAQTVAQPSRPLPSYAYTRQRVYEADLYALEHGGDPQQIAKTVARILKIAHPKPRYRATLDSRIMYFSKLFLPWWWLERFLRYSFLEGSGDVNKPNHLRRLVLDTAYATRWQRLAAIGILGILVILLGLWLLPRLTG